MSLFQLKTEKRVHDSNYTNCRVQALLFQAHHYWYILLHTEDNVSCRVSAYSGAFSWRHNNRPAPTPGSLLYTLDQHLPPHSSTARERSRYTTDIIIIMP